MLTNSQSISEPLTKRRARLILHLAAVALLLFAQVSFASHFHGAELQSHDCSVCLQLHNVKNLTGSSNASAPCNPLAAADTLASTLFNPQAFISNLPPCRAPPR